MSGLRAKCPHCRTLTAVALGAEYECHACGARFGAGLVRVHRAWGDGGEPMVAAAALPLPYPEAAVVMAGSLDEQTREVSRQLPGRPLVLGGCCCAHVGAVEALAARHARVALVWLDAHGDLNTPETSPSGNAWGMPLRMLLDRGTVAPADVALVGARNLDPPERDFIAASGLHADREQAVERALEGSTAAYVAIDADAFDGRDVASFMPEEGGLRLPDVEALFAEVANRVSVVGAGLTGLRPDARNVGPLTRLLSALGL